MIAHVFIKFTEYFKPTYKKLRKKKNSFQNIADNARTPSCKRADADTQ